MLLRLCFVLLLLAAALKFLLSLLLRLTFLQLLLSELLAPLLPLSVLL